MGLESKRSNRLLTSKGYNMKVKDLLKVLYEFTEIKIFEYGAARGEFFYQVAVVDTKYFDREIDQVSASSDETNEIEIVLKKL